MNKFDDIEKSQIVVVGISKAGASLAKFSYNISVDFLPDAVYVINSYLYDRTGIAGTRNSYILCSDLINDNILCNVLEGYNFENPNLFHILKKQINGLYTFYLKGYSAIYSPPVADNSAIITTNSNFICSVTLQFIKFKNK